MLLHLPVKILNKRLSTSTEFGLRWNKESLKKFVSKFLIPTFFFVVFLVTATLRLWQLFSLFFSGHFWLSRVLDNFRYHTLNYVTKHLCLPHLVHVFSSASEIFEFSSEFNGFIVQNSMFSFYACHILYSLINLKSRRWTFEWGSSQLFELEMTTIKIFLFFESNSINVRNK